MTKQKRRNINDHFIYSVNVNDWYVKVEFNDYAYKNLFDNQEFEERIFMVLKGRISSTSSEKCKTQMAAKVMLHPSDVWYDRQLLREDLHSIGNMEIIKSSTGIEKEDTLYFRLGVPTKSYENIRAYLTCKSDGDLTLVGTELYRRKGNIYYLGFQEQVSY